MTYSIPLAVGVDLKLYNGAIAFSKPEIIADEPDHVVVKIETTATEVHFETTVGELIHPGVVKRGAYVEFFHRDNRGRRQWQTPSMLGLAGVDWTVAVQENAGTFEVSFTKP